MAALSSSLLPQTLSASQFLAEAPLRPRESSPCGLGVAPRVVHVVAVKKFQGTVVKTVNNQTAAVEVKRIYAHPLYKKRITSVKRYQAHDPENQCKVGDIVTLAKCAPVSKTKKFVVVEIRAARVAGEKAAAARAAAESLESEVDSLPPVQSEASS